MKNIVICVLAITEQVDRSSHRERVTSNHLMRHRRYAILNKLLAQCALHASVYWTSVNLAPGFKHCSSVNQAYVLRACSNNMSNNHFSVTLFCSFSVSILSMGSILFFINSNPNTGGNRIYCTLHTAQTHSHTYGCWIELFVYDGILLLGATVYCERVELLKMNDLNEWPVMCTYFPRILECCQPVRELCVFLRSSPICKHSAWIPTVD